jgi:hypothetical protein
MKLTKPSNKGQAIVPEAVLLKRKAPFAATDLSQVAGLLKDKMAAKSDAQIEAALVADLRHRFLKTR